jgi:hypothetical protein
MIVKMFAFYFNSADPVFLLKRHFYSTQLFCNYSAAPVFELETIQQHTDANFLARCKTLADSKKHEF